MDLSLVDGYSKEEWNFNFSTSQNTMTLAGKKVTNRGNKCIGGTYLFTCHVVTLCEVLVEGKSC